MNYFTPGCEPSTPRGEKRLTSTQKNANANPPGNSICKTCNHRIRKEGHEKGAHHNNRVYKK